MNRFDSQTETCQPDNQKLLDSKSETYQSNHGQNPKYSEKWKLNNQNNKQYKNTLYTKVQNTG